eukprot:jgi/Astpho2/1996/Aster-00504
MANRLLADPEADGWERSDFPIVCETCLGPNPYVRMQRVSLFGHQADAACGWLGSWEPHYTISCCPFTHPVPLQMEYGGECHISGRPYTVFRWKPGAEARYKKTIICQEVAKAKNVCQVCLLDLDYNLPVQVRDSALGKELEDLPQSDANKEYVLDRLAADGELDAAFTKQQANDTILRLQRTTPYYKRNRAQICSFFVKGECKRGAECPYRHEMPTSGPLAKQNIKDRYYGVNDPVAEKMLGQLDEMPKLVPPEDTTITTLYVGGLTPDITEQHIKDQFYGHGEIMSVRKVDRKHCAFVTFATREAAEAAADALSNRLIIQGNRCRLLWGKPMEKRDNPPPAHNAHLMPSQVQMGAPPAFPGQAPPNFFNLPPGMAPPPGLGGPPGSGPGRPLYPSMDTSAMGTKAARQGDAGSGPEAKRQRMDPAGAPAQA